MNLYKKPDVIIDKQRDFSDTINATFSFVKQEFKPLFKGVALYSFFPLLGLAVALTFYFKSIFDIIPTEAMSPTGSEPLANFPWGWYALLVISALFTQVIMSGFIYEYMYLYKEKGRGNFTTSDAWQQFLKDFWGLLGFSLLTFILFSIITFIFSMGIGFLAVINPIIVIPFFLLFLIGSIFVLVPLTLLWTVKVFEKKGYGYSVSRCFKLTKNSWWKTFGLLFVMNIIASTIGTIFTIPMLIYFIFIAMTGFETGNFEQFNTTLMVPLAFIGTYGSMLVYSLFFLAIGFQYTSLKEEKDNDSILNKIDSISDTSTEPMIQS